MLKTACELEWTQQNINDIIAEYPSLGTFYDEVAKNVGCDKSDLIWLGVQSDFKETDEEGWDIESFFPVGSELKQSDLYKDYHTAEFSIGYVKRIEYNGKIYIAECNASPWMVYANAKDFEWALDTEGREKQ